MGFVYVIGEPHGEGPIKIGRTRQSLRTRLSSLQTGYPRKLEVLGSIEVDKEEETEAALHTYFQDDRLSGEWFEVSAQVAIEILNKFYTPPKPKLEKAVIHAGTDIGELIRERRKSLGVLQEDLADLCGCSVRWIRDVEKGKLTMEYQMVLTILGVLGLTVCIGKVDESGN